jgi:hypothetical protein
MLEYTLFPIYVAPRSDNSIIIDSPSSLELSPAVDEAAYLQEEGSPLRCCRSVDNVPVKVQQRPRCFPTVRLHAVVS